MIKVEPSQLISRKLTANLRAFNWLG